MVKPKTPARGGKKAVRGKAPVDKATAATPLAGTGVDMIGQPGFPQYGGFVQDDILRELIGARGRNVFREMADNDATCASLVFAFNTLMGGAPWEFQPVDETPQAAEAVEFAESVLFKGMNTPWRDVVADAATMLVYGFAVQEILWMQRKSDNMIGVADFSPRSQHTIWQWTFDPKSFLVTEVIQQPPSGTQIRIPVDKCVLFKTGPTRGNPEGRSILRGAYRSWSLKKRIENIEGIGIERDLAGLPMVLVPAAMLDPKADPEQRAALAAYKTLVKRVRRDSQEGIVMPSTRDQNGNLLYEFKLLSTGGTRSFDTTKVLDRYGKAIAMSVLADFIYLGQQSVGSFALSSDKTELFGVAVGTYLDRIEDCYNKQFMPRLWANNALDPDLMPKLKHGDVEQSTLAEVVSVINTIISAGGILDYETENSMRQRAGLPLLPEEGMGDVGAPGTRGPVVNTDPNKDDDKEDEE